MSATVPLDVATLVRRAAEKDDRRRVAQLVARYPLETWFGLPPSELQLILEMARVDVLRQNPGWGVLLSRFMSPPVAGDGGKTGLDSVEGEWDDVARYVEASQHRLEGDPVAAYQALREIVPAQPAVSQLIDPTRGLRPFIAQQTGLVAMLCGHFQEALAQFERSLAYPLPASLGFLRRDAQLRIALIHVLYGDRAEAATRLELAQQVPRTGSWAEGVLDSDERLVTILLSANDDPDVAMTELVRIPISQMQELWPFHVIAAEHLGMLTGRIDEMYQRAVQFRDLGLTGARGTGLPGSVIPTTLANHAVLTGAGSQAKHLLATASRQFWETTTATAGVSLFGGSAGPAIRLLRGARDQTRGLRQADDFRQMVLAVAHVVAGSPEEGRAILADLGPDVDPLTRTMLHLYAPNFAASVVEQLPEWAVPPRPSAIRATSRKRSLTAREHEVLACLADGVTRGEMAKSMFVTVNTVKTHLRSLYRKLGVDTREDALREAHRRALI